jgi:SAM-dependent methyltransferase
MALTESLLRLLSLVLVGSLLVPIVTAVCSALAAGVPGSPRAPLLYAAAVALVAAAAAGAARLRRRHVARIDQLFFAQAEFVDALPPHRLDAAIFCAAALSLFLELTVIRWQGTVFEFFAFYKNFTLLSCFAGLGLGYALAGRDRLALPAVVPLLVWQFGFLTAFRFAMPSAALESIRHLPFAEQLTMGMRNANQWSEGIATYFFLSVAFVLTVLAFIPVGQLCGRLMRRRDNLRSYGLNLIGSLCGVVLMFAVSFLWTPPIVWFGLAFAAILLFHVRVNASLVVGAGSALAGLVVLAWPVEPMWDRIYSPYQILALGHTERGQMLIRAAGTYYQRVHDLSAAAPRDPETTRIRNYYDLPYRIRPGAADVAIVGAGSGNDVAAAVRAGARRIDAIEIDPAILLAGKLNHPEHPYSQPQVRPIVNDARRFIRATEGTYDLIVYGLLDSHTLLSHASSVRLDSFVYTVEGIREARARLRPGGVLSLSFSLMSNQIGRKIQQTLESAFDGRPPLCVEAQYDLAVTFFQSDQPLTLPEAGLRDAGFADCGARFANAAIKADVSTDDWPFFYMPRRTYPVSYLVMIALILYLTRCVMRAFGEEPIGGQTPLFLLGAGFMLVETKAITEMGLTFGNTWQVVGVVIAGILIMAFLANVVVQRLAVRRSFIPFVLLLSALAAGVLVARSGGLPSTTAGQIGTVLLLTSPVFFSGIVFSSLVAASPSISSAMAANLFGAMCGGLLEYNAMYFGFQFLYWLAGALYAGAFLISLRQPKAAVVSGFSRT